MGKKKTIKVTKIFTKMTLDRGNTYVHIVCTYCIYNFSFATILMFTNKKKHRYTYIK